MITILKRLGCRVVGTGNFKVTPPSWRADLNLREDIAEEVGRIYGYNNFVATRMVGELHPGVVHPNWHRQQELRGAFIGMGWSEVLTYSFYGADMKTVGEHLEVEGAMSASQQYLRRSIVPRLIEAVGKNARTQSHVALFEIGHVFFPSKNTLPDEPLTIAGAFVANDDVLAFRNVRGALEALAIKLGRNPDQIVQSANIHVVTDEEKSVAKIKQSVAVFECAVQDLYAASKHARTLALLSEFPSIERDLSIVLDTTVSWEKIKSLLMRHGGSILEKVELLEVYRGKEISVEKHALTIRMTFRVFDRTLTSNEVEEKVSAATLALAKEFNAAIR